MGPIVCATRGGEASRRTHERAVTLARERGADLIFMYVADPSFAGALSEAMEAALIDELRRLGRSLLNIARARARKQGVKAKMAIRCGPVWEKIEEYLQEVNATTLVIGLPKGGATLERFEPEELQEQAEKVCQIMEIELVVVR